MGVEARELSRDSVMHGGDAEGEAAGACVSRLRLGSGGRQGVAEVDEGTARADRADDIALLLTEYAPPPQMATEPPSAHADFGPSP